MPRKSKLPYRKRRLLFVLALAAYGSAALVSGLGFHHREIFPIFSWSLFSHIPGKVTDFAVLVTARDGETLEPTSDFITAQELPPGAKAIRAYNVVQSLGRAILHRDGPEIDRQRQLLESQYLVGADRDLEYLVVVRTYDPVESLRTGRFEARPAARFTSGDGPAEAP